MAPRASDFLTIPLCNIEDPGSPSGLHVRAYDIVSFTQPGGDKPPIMLHTRDGRGFQIACFPDEVIDAIRAVEDGETHEMLTRPWIGS